VTTKFLYLAKRTDNIGYDENEGALIVADSGPDAETFLLKLSPKGNTDVRWEYEVIGVSCKYEASEILLTDFNAG
jgi:hypothetical protein